MNDMSASDIRANCFFDACDKPAERSIARYDAYNHVAVTRDYCAEHADVVTQTWQLLRGNGETKQ